MSKRLEKPKKPPTLQQKEYTRNQNIVAILTISFLIFGIGFAIYTALNPQIEEKQPAKGNVQGQILEKPNYLQT